MKLSLFILLLCSSHFGYCQNPQYDVIEDKNPLEILTPALKDRKSIKIRLKNGLETYIISDLNANESAAALAVETGSWNDPIEYPGMAHFCEHMLFMGSKKYPDENGFFKMVQDSGGVTNAYTKPDRTVYMFSSSNESFDPILDIFSHFFIDPLFKADAVKRELLAVNQEHEKNIEHDGWREWMIFKETGNQNHVNAKFSTGTEETLAPISIDILANWFQTNYSANQMHLVIYSNQEIDKLIKLVQNSFNEILPSQPPELAYEPLTSSMQKGQIIYIEPIKELKKLTVGWEMPVETARDLNGKPPLLIGYALTHKGENSLYQYLAKKGLCENISYECDLLDKSTMMLNFTFDLTKQGIVQIDFILENIFQAINHMKNIGIPSYLFNEAKKMAELQYQWQSRTSPFAFVMNTADEMVNEPISTYPYKSTTISSYKPASIAKTLSQMTPENALYFVTASSDLTAQTPDKQEKWLGGYYSVVSIEEEKIQRWKEPQNHVLLKSPEPNPFIPNKITLINQGSSKETFQPLLLSDDSFGKYYLLQDHFYKVPEVIVLLGLKSPLINPSLKSIALTDLFSIHLEQSLSPLLSSGSRAGLTTAIYQKDLKLNIALLGYYEKAPLLLTRVFEAMKKASPSRQEFLLYKENLLSQYENQSKSLPVFQARDLMMSILYNNAPTGDDLKNILMQLTYEDFSNYLDKLFHQIYIEAIIAGNIEEERANTIWKNTKTALSALRYPTENHHKKEILLLPKTKGPYTIESTSEMQGNATLLMLQLGKHTFAKSASHKVLEKPLAEAFFNTLRTKQQTGYITKSWAQDDVNELIYFFAVHSTTHYSQELLARFELFIENFSREIKTRIPKDRFDYLKNTLITNLKKPPQNLKEKAMELNALAFTHNGDFLRRQEQIHAIENLNYEQFIKDAQNFLTRKNSKRIAILVTGPPSSDKAFSYITTTPSALKQLHEKTSSL